MDLFCERFVSENQLALESPGGETVRGRRRISGTGAGESTLIGKRVQ